MGDFLGFTFGGVHSSDLGITRVSGGDRYEEQLHPEIKDRTAEVPGLNGEYYFGSDFGSRSFDIEVAFDSLTEEQFRNLRRVFGTKDIKKLIFDERPYKYYMAKIESPIELSYVCFDEPKKVRFSELYPNEELPDGVRMVDDGEGNRTIEKIDPWVSLEGTQRIYKGEGKISFKAYFPFAKSVYKVLPSEEEESSWAVSSGILTQSDYAQFDNYDNETGIIQIHNAGDISTGFRLYCSFEKAQSMKLIYTSTGSITSSALNIDTITPKINRTNENDIGFLINTNNCLIQGVQEIGLNLSGNVTTVVSGNIYNEFIDSGYFFKFEPNCDGILQIADFNNNIINSADTGYVPTEDEDIVEGKIYYTREWHSDHYEFEEVNEPIIDNIDNYYESIEYSAIQIFYDYLYF